MPVSSGGSSFRLDLARRRVHVRGCEIALTGVEYRTLWILVQGRGGALRFRDIAIRVWGDAAGPHRTALRRTIQNLRRKLTGCSDDGLLLMTEPRVGYRLRLTDT
jgi:two-component system KDP operon response regulator KdpE